MWRRRLISSLLIAGSAYAALCGLVYAKQTSLLLFPTREVRLTPADIGLKYSELALPTQDGETLHGWAVEPEGAGLWVLHCHGNGANIAARLGTLHMLASCGVGVVFFDYRGYGKSTGAARQEADLLADAEAACQYLVGRGIPSERLVIFGESLGGGVAAALAERHPPRGLILQSTFTSVVDRASQLYPYLPVRWLSKFRLDTLSRIGKLSCPKLILHSAGDEVIPYAHGRKLFATASEPKRFVELSGGHNDEQPALGPAVREFLAGL